MEDKQLQAELVHAINLHLDLCDSSETPIVCNMLQTSEGRDKLINLVVDKVLNQQLDIPASITSIEVEFDINSLD